MTTTTRKTRRSRPARSRGATMTSHPRMSLATPATRMTRVAGEEEEVVDTETDIGDLEGGAAAANTRTRNTRVRTKNTRATRATGTRTGKERGKTLVPTDTTASRQRKNDTKSKAVTAFDLSNG